MANKSSIDLDTEEYKMQEDSNIQQDYDNPDLLLTPKEAIISKVKNLRVRRLFIPVVLIVAIILIYQFLSWYSHRKERSAVKQEEVITKKYTQKDMAAAYQQQVGGGSVVIDSKAVNAANTALQQKFDTLALKTDSTIGQLQKLQNDVMQTQTTLTNLSQTVDVLSKTVQELSGNVQYIVASANKGKEKGKTKKLTKKVVIKQVLYHIRAIVPGLAWLESSSGEVFAVRVGDELGGYGRIRLISPKQGMVITENGTVIQYGVNDF